MGKSWQGFMAQNELVKLEWAAMEESQEALNAKGFTVFFSGERQEQGCPPKEDAMYSIFCERKATKAK